MAATNELMIERGGQAGSAARRRANFAIFLGPAIVLTVLFFVIPVLIDIAVSFTDLSRSLRVTKFTTEQYAKIFQGDRRLPQVIGLTVRLRFRHARHLQRDLRPHTRAHHHVDQQGSWRLLPRRMAPAAHEPVGSLHSAVAVGHQSVRSRAAEPDPDAGARPRQTARSDDRGADRAHHHFQRLHRRIDGDDHLHRRDTRHPEHLFHAAAVDGAGVLAQIRFITLPRCAGRSAL